MHAVVALFVALSAVQTPYDTVYDQLKNLATLPNGVAAVHGVVLRRDAMELRLDDGFAFQLTPVGGRPIGIAYVGSGSLSFAPPLVVEQFNLKRVMGDTTINGPITAAVFLFADSTGTELARSLKFGPAPGNAPDPSAAIDAALDYVMEKSAHSADESLLIAALNATNTGYFAAYVKRQKGESVMIQYDPAYAEEVFLLRRGHMPGQRTEVVCQFQSANEIVKGLSVADEQPDALIAVNYDLEASIDNNYKYAGKANERVVGRPGRFPLQWADFGLYGELEVDSITTKDGTPLTFHRKKDEGELWVRFPKPLAGGDTLDLRFVYHGNLIGFGSTLDDIIPPWFDQSERSLATTLDQWAYIKSSSTWFPRYSFVQSVPVTMTFHTPRKLKFAAIGQLADSSTTGDVTTTHWVSERPARNISFNIGHFDEIDIKDPRIPPVTVHVNTDAHAAIHRFIPSARNPADMVGADVANSLSFFTQMYGPPLFHQYVATEIPYFHGEAFPGMIHLSFTTFLGLSTDGEDEIFRAHEMAHQWWGIGVEPAGYRDRWLSEGFSEFSGMWYMQMILHDNDKYLKALKNSREVIRRERTKAAPLGIGTRAADSWRGDYQLITYEKGAWVLHMLRNMLLDTHTMSEDRFVATMHDFYTSYRGKRATTDDFQKVVERHVGQPMDWFFNEWVYGTAVPTYTFSWTTEPDSGGNGRALRMRVRQSDVPDGFSMYVPVLIKFAQGEALVRIAVRGPTSETRIRLPAEPTEVQLNPLESVLAEVKTEGWH